MADFEFDRPRPARRRPQQEPASMPGWAWGVLAGGVVLFLVLTAAGLAYHFSGATAQQQAAAPALGAVDGQTRQRHQDYFGILEVNYELTAAAQVALTWLDPDIQGRPGLRVSGDLRSHEATQPIVSRARGLTEMFERMAVDRRGDFLKRHGIDSKAWKDAFAKDYPERDLIFDEVKVTVREACKRQAAECGGHLLDRYGEMINLPIGAFQDYRRDYMEARAQKMVEEAVSEAKALKSIAKLKAKVLAP